jgi:putative membrane protein insertion efficiency factor
MSKLMKWLLLSFIWIYRTLISPLITPQCRFLPTCSQYAIDALEEYGAWRGTFLTVKRICRCQPWGGSGFDPVPKGK